MPPIIAHKTLDKIDNVMKADGGASYRKHLRAAIAACEDAYREDDGGFRTHLGASLIGRECPRELWFTFRWATESKPEPRILRLFNRGHLEEGRFVALLKMIGCDVWQYDEKGRQFRVGAHGGHFGGSLDGVIRGIPEMPLDALLTEFKTHGEKSFAKLAGSPQKNGKRVPGGEGVRAAKFEHFVQQQVYMGTYGLEWSLYCAVNKNTDDLYMELVPFDREMYERHVHRGGLIVKAEEPPPQISKSPGWFACRFCDHKQVCHYRAAPVRTCRSCRHVNVATAGTWYCLKHEIVVDKKAQLEACADYERLF